MNRYIQGNKRNPLQYALNFAFFRELQLFAGVRKVCERIRGMSGICEHGGQSMIIGVSNCIRKRKVVI